MHSPTWLSALLVAVFTAGVPLAVPGADPDTDLAARLQVLEDREAIRELLIEYGRTLDERDFEAFSKLFSSNGGEWNGGMGVARGPAEIREMMENTIGRNTLGINAPNFHIFNNETIEVDGDTATAVSKWSFIVQGDDQRPQWVYLGHYHDKLVRENGIWKFRQRVVTGAIPGADR